MTESQVDLEDFERRVEEFKLHYRVNEASRDRVSDAELTKRAQSFVWDDIALDGLSDVEKRFARNFREMLHFEFSSNGLTSPTFSMEAPAIFLGADKEKRMILERFITKETFEGVIVVSFWELLMMNPIKRARLEEAVVTHPKTGKYVFSFVKRIPIFSRGMDESMKFHFSTLPAL